MKANLQRTITTNISAEQLGAVLTQWAAQEKFSTQQIGPGKWQFTRGGLVAASLDPTIWWHPSVIPTTVTVERLNTNPPSVSCTLDASLPYRVIPGANTKFEQLFEQLLARIGNPVVGSGAPTTATSGQVGTGSAVCPDCGANVTAQMRFCGACGTDLSSPTPAKAQATDIPSAQPSCPDCHALLPENAAFCPECGHQVHE